jgi:hypothetical protein
LNGAGILVLVGATLALAVSASMWLWRRRQLALAAGRSHKVWVNEHTHYATTYEELGMDPPGAEREDATACMAYEELGFSEPADATAFIDMQAIVEPAPAPAPAPPEEWIPRLEGPPQLYIAAPSDLSFAFDLAVNAYLEWRSAMAGPRSLEAIAHGPEQAWTDGLADLYAAFTASESDLLASALRDPMFIEARTVAALALLEHREADTVALICEVMPDPAPFGEHLLEALRLWRGPSADDTLRHAALSYFPRHALGFARLLRERGTDPGGELVTRYLDAGQVELVRAGLELLAVHADRRYQWSAITARLFETNPEVQDAAIEAGMRLREEIAWAQCRQLAMTPGRERLRELFALLAEPEQQRELVEWAGRDNTPPDALWCAALTGRVEAVELALSRLNSKHNSLARRCLAHLCGSAEVDPGGWQDRRERFDPGRRWLMGEPYELGVVRRALEQRSAPHRSALALELEFRAPRLPHLHLDTYAWELLRELDELERQGRAAVDEPEIDFERSFPWASGARA